MRLTRTILLLLLISLPRAAGGADGENPRASGGDRWLRLAPPPAVLADEVVARELESGLTTTFAFTVNARGHGEGGARVEIRYQLWDEEFHVLAVGLDGRPRRAELGSREELQAWWGALRLAVLDLQAPPRGRPPPAGDPEQVKVVLDVVPFSSREEKDTQRWLAESLARDDRGGGEAVEERPSALGQVFNVLIATSIRRRAVRSYRWTVPVDPGKP